MTLPHEDSQLGVDQPAELFRWMQLNYAGTEAIRSVERIIAWLESH
jgi:hypothetical protein